MSKAVKILASTYGRGNAGDIILTAEDIVIQGSSPSEQIQSGIGNSVETGQGDAGNIGINTRRLTLSEGGQLGSGTSGNGNGGSIVIVADDISVIGTTPSESFVSAISTASNADAQGNAGNIDIQTDNLNLLNGGQIFFWHKGHRKWRQH